MKNRSKQCTQEFCAHARQSLLHLVNVSMRENVRSLGPTKISYIISNVTHKKFTGEDREPAKRRKK